MTEEQQRRKNNRTALAVVLATAIAAPAEGMRQVAYLDPVGIPTICMGHTKGVKMGDRATPEQCEAMLSDEMREYVNVADKCVPDMPVHVLAAVSDAAYNLGEGVVCDPKRTLAAKLRARDWVGACNALLLYDKAAGVTLPGLTKRRRDERELCLTKDEPDESVADTNQPSPPRPQALYPPRPWYSSWLARIYRLLASQA